MEQFNAVVAAVKANAGKVIDDHGNGTGTLNAAGIGLLQCANGKQKPVLLVNTRYFSLNEVYIDEKGLPHVSRMSVGGAVVPMNHASLQAAVEGYNNEQAALPFAHSKLAECVYL